MFLPDYSYCVIDIPSVAKPPLQLGQTHSDDLVDFWDMNLNQDSYFSQTW